MRYINTDCANNGDGTAVSCAASPGATGAYDSCDNAESDIDSSLSDDWTIYASGATADPSGTCTFAGTTTGSYTIKLEGDPTNPEGFNDTGVWSTSYYRITSDEYWGGINIDDPNVTIKNIQIDSNGEDAGDERAMGIRVMSNCSGTYTFRGLIIRYSETVDPTTNSNNNGIHTTECDTSGVVYNIVNNVIYDFRANCIDVQLNGSQSAYVYNNTAASCEGAGVSMYCPNSSDTIKLRNNILYDNVSNDYVSWGNPDTLVTSKTITKDATSPDSDCGAGGSSSCASTTVTFTGAPDYHTSDSDVVDRGADLSADGDYSFSDDFEGDSRSGSWDIGADESAAATPTPTPTNTPTNTPTHTPTPTWTPTATPAGGGGTGTVDVDRDGYNSDGVSGSMGLAHKDCDDDDSMIYPGVYVGCDCGEGANTGYKLCGTDGNYGSCTCNSETPLCESSGSGSCYYVDCDSGNDSNAGSYASPWATPQNVGYWSTGAPATHVGNLAAGDVLYVWGTCTATYDIGNWQGDVWLGGNAQDGTAANPITIRNYPGKSNLIDPSCTYSSQCAGIRTYVTSHWTIKGLSITGTFDSAIWHQDEGSDTDMDVEGCTIYENDGNGNDNMAGIRLDGGQDSQVHHNKIYDNYNITGYGNDQNTVNVYIAGANGHDVHHNTIYYSATTGSRASSYNIKVKQGSSNPAHDFTVRYNFLQNGGVGVGTANPGTYIHHNIFHSQVSRGIEYRDLGNTTCFDDFKAEYNTFVNVEPIWYEPWSGDCGAGNFLFTFRYNVINDDRASPYDAGNALQRICANTGQCTNALYTTLHTGSKFTIDENCYFNNQEQTEMWAFWEGGESSGDLYAWADWNTLGYDSSSFVEDPILNAEHEATSSNCDGWGWILPVAAAATATPTPTNTPTSTNTNTPVNTATPAALERPQGTPLLKIGALPRPKRLSMYELSGGEEKEKG